MTPSESNISRRLMIHELILGWFDTIMKAPEIQILIPKNPRNFLRNMKNKISNCASQRFLENYNGFRWIRERNTENIEKYIIESVKDCI